MGRFEEAFALATRPDVADHHHAVQFRSRLALDLIARATRRGAVDDLGGAIEDLDLAERMGAPPDSLAAARLSLADRVAEEVRADLDSGDPARALERIEDLARHKVSGPALRRTREIAEAWQAALGEGRAASSAGAGAARPGRTARRRRRGDRRPAGGGRGQGRTGDATEGRRPQGGGPLHGPLRGEVADDPHGGRGGPRGHPRAPGGPAGPVAGLAADRRHRPGRPGPMGGPGPRGAQAAAAINPRRDPAEPARPATDDRDRPEAVAEVRPRRGRRHLLARRRGVPSRRRGLRAPAGQNTAPPAGRPRRPAGRPRPTAGPRRGRRPKGRFLLWVDGVGGYLVCMDDRIVLGRAGADSHADVPLMGDLSRNHATLVRNGEGYLLQAHHASFVNGKPVAEQVVLRDGDVIRLGSTVELEFRQPSPVSATARLAIVSRHRLPLAVDGVLLMAETCIVGEAAQAHIPAPALQIRSSSIARPARCGAAPRRLRCRREDLRRPRPR